LFSSILRWGPPGTDKTTASASGCLAQVIANITKSHFETISAVLADKADLREASIVLSSGASSMARVRSCS